MKKARLIFLASLLIMAIAAFKGDPQAENIPSIQNPPTTVQTTDSTIDR